MTDFHLNNLYTGVQSELEARLASARQAITHAGVKGGTSENIWLEFFGRYLPRRYSALSAHVVDSNNKSSEQCDIVVIDRQYSPFIFVLEGASFVPAESVYAVIEAKQTLSAFNVDYAAKKVSSVRALARTSLPIPWASETLPAKTPGAILGGVVALDSEWSPPFGDSLARALTAAETTSFLDLGCAVQHGRFRRTAPGEFELLPGHCPAVGFLFDLISRLQALATVPMIDMAAYGRWL